MQVNDSNVFILKIFVDIMIYIYILYRLHILLHMPCSEVLESLCEKAARPLWMRSSQRSHVEIQLIET